MVIFFGGAGIKIAKASQTTAAPPRIADSTMDRCQRLNPSMNISPRFAATKKHSKRRRMRTAHQSFSLSSEFHAYGAAPREVRKGLARFGTKHSRHFMPMTNWLDTVFSINERVSLASGVIGRWADVTNVSGIRSFGLTIGVAVKLRSKA